MRNRSSPPSIHSHHHPERKQRGTHFNQNTTLCLFFPGSPTSVLEEGVHRFSCFCNHSYDLKCSHRSLDALWWMPCVGVESPSHAIRADADPLARSATSVVITLADKYTYDCPVQILIYPSGRLPHRSPSNQPPSRLTSAKQWQRCKQTHLPFFFFGGVWVCVCVRGGCWWVGGWEGVHL